jgi:NADPH:quinone reductase-like Zn-dependent oxidoreductase
LLRFFCQRALYEPSRTALRENLIALVNTYRDDADSRARGSSPAEKGAIARELEREVWPLLDRGDVRPIVHAEFPLERAADAHRELESGIAIGKVVLVM